MLTTAEIPILGDPRYSNRGPDSLIAPALVEDLVGRSIVAAWTLGHFSGGLDDVPVRERPSGGLLDTADRVVEHGELLVVAAGSGGGRAARDAAQWLCVCQASCRPQARSTDGRSRPAPLSSRGVPSLGRSGCAGCASRRIPAISRGRPLPLIADAGCEVADRRPAAPRRPLRSVLPGARASYDDGGKPGAARVRSLLPIANSAIAAPTVDAARHVRYTSDRLRLPAFFFRRRFALSYLSFHSNHRRGRAVDSQRGCQHRKVDSPGAAV